MVVELSLSRGSRSFERILLFLAGILIVLARVA